MAWEASLSNRDRVKVLPATDRVSSLLTEMDLNNNHLSWDRVRCKDRTKDQWDATHRDQWDLDKDLLTLILVRWANREEEVNKDNKEWFVDLLPMACKDQVDQWVGCKDQEDRWVEAWVADPDQVDQWVVCKDQVQWVVDLVCPDKDILVQCNNNNNRIVLEVLAW